MKFFDKLGLVLFSIIVLIISMIICLLNFGWINLNVVISYIYNIRANELASNITLGISIFLALLSLKCIFFNSFINSNTKTKDSILLENDNGKLLVSKDTLESLTNTVVKSFESAESVMTKVEVDEENSIKIFITLFVYPDAIIKDLSNKLQTNVKSTIKKSLDLEITEVNIRIKNISVKKEPIIKE